MGKPDARTDHERQGASAACCDENQRNRADIAKLTTALCGLTNVAELTEKGFSILAATLDAIHKRDDAERQRCHSHLVTRADLSEVEFRLRRDIRKLRHLIFQRCGTGRHAVGFSYRLGLPKLKTKAQTMLDITITNEQEIPLTLIPTTETGQPAKLDGIPTVTVISGNSTASVAEDGTIVLRSADEPGDSDFLVEADADLGAGVQTISDIVHLHVSGAMAKNLGLTAGTPRAKSVA